MELENRHQLRIYQRYPLVVDRGEGAWIHTIEDRPYLDMFGGQAVALLGHCHPHVVEAIRRQAGRLTFYSNLIHNPQRALAAQFLTDLAPEGLSRVFFVNSGAEANENALKLARKLSGRTPVLSFEGSFHGRTIGALSATGIQRMRAPFHPNVPDHFFCPFGDLEAVEGALSQRDFAAVLLEPIQSMGGVQVASPGFYSGLRDLCSRRGAFLVYDEVQTGMGRTGELFFAFHHGAFPDMITLAKGMAGGVPMGAVVVSEEIASRVGYGDLGSTFGGGPLACAALIATMEVLAEGSVLENVRRVSGEIRRGCLELEGVEEVQGLGFLLGVRMRKPAVEVQKSLLEAGVIAGTCTDPQVLRLLPPLVLKSEEAADFLSRLRSSC